MSAQAYLASRGVSMSQAYEFILGNLQDLQLIFNICKQFGVTTDMIGEVLSFGGLAVDGEGVANYFAQNGFDANLLGGTAPTVEVLNRSDDNQNGVLTTDSQGRVVMQQVDTNQDGVYDLMQYYEYRDDGSYVVSQDNDMNGLYEEFVIYNADGVKQEEWFDHNENDYFGARMIFDIEGRPIEFYLDENEDRSYDSVTRWSYQEDGSYTLNKDTDFSGIYEEYSLYDSDENLLETWFDRNENGYYEEMLVFDSQGREIELRSYSDVDGEFVSATSTSYDLTGLHYFGY